MFEQLVLVDHPNIVKLHKYWLDVKDSKARVGRAQGGRAPRGPQAGEGCQWEPSDDPSPACQGQRRLCLVLVAQGGREADTSLPCQVIFITEYVSSGSLKQFLKKTKKNHKAMNARVGSLEAAQGVPGEGGGTERVSGLLQGRTSVCSCSLNCPGAPTVGRWPLGEGWCESRTSPGHPRHDPDLWVWVRI